MLARNAVVASERAFGVFPEFLSAVNVVDFPSNKRMLMVDPMMMEFRHIQHIVDVVAVGIDHGIEHHLGADDRHQRVALQIGCNHRVDAAAAFEDAENGHFARSTASPPAFAMAPEIALVDLHFAVERRLFDQPLSDELAQTMEKQDGPIWG